MFVPISRYDNDACVRSSDCQQLRDRATVASDPISSVAVEYVRHLTDPGG